MFYDIFISLCAEKGKKPSDVSRELGIGKSTISMWKKQNSIPSAVTLMQLAEYFNVTPAYLAGNSMAKKPLGDTGDQKEKAPALTEKDKRDAAKEVKRIMDDLENSGELMFDGVPLSDEARESLAAAMKLGLEAARLKNKETYTSKKYRK